MAHIIRAFDDDLEKVNALRKELTESGIHGSRITILHLPNLDYIPLTSCVGNLVCTERGTPPCSSSELSRLTRPKGRTVLPDRTLNTRPPREKRSKT